MPPGARALTVRGVLAAARSLLTGQRREGGWVSVVRESEPGAWQHNVELGYESALAYAPVFACVDLLSSDCAKLRWRLVEQTDEGIWLETDNSAYSPLLRRPNGYQVPFQFTQQWMTSKLAHGNTYALKQRDSRGVVAALYLLDPTRVTPLVAPDGSIFYEVTRDDLAGLSPEAGALFSSLWVDGLSRPGGGGIAIPAREIIHDRGLTPFHPLCGVSPIFAAAMPAAQGLMMQRNSAVFFRNSAQPGGVLIAPGLIKQEQSDKLKAAWTAAFSGDKYGQVAVLDHGLKYEPLTVNAVDAELVKQLEWTGQMICSVYHVPAYMIGLGDPPPYANVEPLLQLYYSQGIHKLLVSAEQTMDSGLEFPRTTLGTEFDIDDLIWLNAETRAKAATDGIGSGALTPNEARKKYYNLPGVPGGATPYLQQQYWPLAQLAGREIPVPAPAPPPPADDEDEAEDLDAAAIGDEAAAQLRAWWRATV